MLANDLAKRVALVALDPVVDPYAVLSIMHRFLMMPKL